MWYLKDNEERIVYVVPQKTEVIIGRSPDPTICDFVINDPSISRRHALLAYINNKLYITDLGSRYGTYVNDTKVEIPNVNLRHGHVVKFGRMDTIWHVHKDKMVTCSSTLKGENLALLNQILSKVGGVLKLSWDDTCKYLTMPSITLTIKVVLSLMQGAHIVTINFWQDCLAAISSNKALPDPKLYIPEVMEATLHRRSVTFLPNAGRAKLFAGKKFIFLSNQQFDMYKPVLLKGLATPLLLDVSNYTNSMLSEDNTVVIAHNKYTKQESEAQINQTNEIINYLKSKGKRLIADAEIGLALLYVSINQFCNPSYDLTPEVFKQNPAPQPTQKVSAQDTQEQSCSTSNLNTKIKNEISSDSLDSNVTSTTQKISDNGGMTFDSSKNLPTTSGTKYNNGGTNSLNKNQAQDEQKDKDLFIFTDTEPNNASDTDNKSEKLNLNKPQKRNAELDTKEDDLFNFVQDEANVSSKRKLEEKETSAPTSSKKQKLEHDPVDTTVEEWSKPEELNKINETESADTVIKPQEIKKETDPDEKMECDVGAALVVINESLIVKKEALETENREKGQVNFKKFKKVWPVKVQTTTIPSSAMIVVKANEISEPPINDETA